MSTTKRKSSVKPLADNFANITQKRKKSQGLLLDIEKMDVQFNLPDSPALNTHVIVNNARDLSQRYNDRKTLITVLNKTQAAFFDSDNNPLWETSAAQSSLNNIDLAIADNKELSNLVFQLLVNLATLQHPEQLQSQRAQRTVKSTKTPVASNAITKANFELLSTDLPSDVKTPQMHQLLNNIFQEFGLNTPFNKEQFDKAFNNDHFNGVGKREDGRRITVQTPWKLFYYYLKQFVEFGCIKVIKQTELQAVPDSK